MKGDTLVAQKQQRLWSKTLQYYWQNMRGNRLRFGLMLFFSAAAVICGDVIASYFLADLFNKLPLAVAGEISNSEVWRVVVYGLSAATGSIIFWRFFGYTWLKVIYDLPKKNAMFVFEHMMDRSYNFFTNTFGGSLVNKFNQFKWSAGELIATFVFELWTAMIRVVFFFFVLFVAIPPVALGLLGWVVFYITTVVFMVRKKSPISRLAVKARSKTTDNFADVITNILTVKNFAGRDFETNRFEETVETEKLANRRSWILNEHIRSYQAFISIVFRIVVLVVSVAGALNGSYEVSAVILAQFYIQRLNQDVFAISKVIQDIEKKFNDAHEMVEIFEKPILVNDSAKPEKLAIKDGAISFNDMTFVYSDGDEKVFNDFNLQIPKGQRVGLVGHSGSGKSTIVKLLLRYEDITSGEIAIDGQNIANITQEDLRSVIATVPQEPVLFHRSIMDNIRYGNPDASDKEVESAAKKANAHAFITALPKGYETLVGERGIKLSGGEKQRVAIARAILSKAPLLILDEATSALDSESELLIQEALNRLMKNRTTIVIAHRLSTIKAMDRIIVLDKGEIIEDGKHATLLKKKGQYAKLWSHQAGGFIQEG